MRQELKSRSSVYRVALFALFVPFLLGGCAPEGSASCAAPEITLSTVDVEQGDAITVEANNLWSDCFDTGQGVAAPASGVPIALVYDDSEAVSLASVDAATDGTIRETVRIPTDAPTGAAALRVGDFYSVPVTIAPAS